MFFKKNISIVYLFIFMSLFSSCNEAKDFFDENEKGWFWYETPPPEVKKEVKKELVQNKTSLQKLEKQGEDLKEAIADAILNPSPKNYKKYMEMNKKIQEQSQYFATGIKQTIWTNPDFDYSLEKPNDAAAIISKNEYINKENDRKLMDIAKNNGLLFFYDGDCVVCSRFSPIIKKFSKQYGFELIGSSLDGSVLNGFDSPNTNKSLIKKLGVTVAPSIYLVNPVENKVIAVSFGFDGWNKFMQKLIYAGERMNGDIDEHIYSLTESKD